MQKTNAHPNQIYPGRYVYVLPMPDSREPQVKTFGAAGWLLRRFGVTPVYTVTPRKFDRFGRCTHESRRLEVTTRHSCLLLSRWE